jgi:hypothetical protein
LTIVVVVVVMMVVMVVRIDGGVVIVYEGIENFSCDNIDVMICYTILLKFASSMRLIEFFIFTQPSLDFCVVLRTGTRLSHRVIYHWID